MNPEDALARKPDVVTYINIDTSIMLEIPLGPYWLISQYEW